jgi:hypothetical protein
VSSGRDKGETPRGSSGIWVSQHRDVGEWIQGAITLKVRAYRDPEISMTLKGANQATTVIAFLSLFGHHPRGEPAWQAASHHMTP